jgi:ABC-type antimicrobial peptide transport system ATPase subunit
MSDDHFDDLRARLDDIAEELADIGLAKLKEALSEDDLLAAAQERRVARARRAVLRAAALLAGDAEDGPD